MNLKSFREASRFAAVDARGVVHTVVERVEMTTPKNSGVCREKTVTGVSVYYSMKTGDALTLLADGSFEGCHRALSLRRVDGETLVT